MAESVAYSLSGPVATLKICREERHNALGASELDAIEAVLSAIDDDHIVRALVVTNSGNKTFCAGASLDELNTEAITPDRFQSAMERLACLAIPSIASINGDIYGGGVELALSCDFRLGVTGTRLRVPAASIGLCYPPAGITRFVNKLGANVARRMLIAGETLDAEELHRIGFLDFLVEPEQLDERVEALSVHLSGLAPLAVSAMKELVAQAETGEIDTVRAAELAARCSGSRDLQEGFAAIREKREAVFTGT